MRVAARYVVCVRAGIRLCVCKTAMYVARVGTGTHEQIGQFGHALGGFLDKPQHKPRKGNGQNRTNRPSFTLKVDYLPNESRVISMPNWQSLERT